MWLEDFQKGLLLLKLIRSRITFFKRYCTINSDCIYLDRNSSVCDLFGTSLKIFSVNEKHVRCQKCKNIFGE